jgi:hypothetical protein
MLIGEAVLVLTDIYSVGLVSNLSAKNVKVLMCER